MLSCSLCRTENKMTDRSLWREWKLLGRVSFTPEPEVSAQLVCGLCAAGYAATHPRTKTMLFPVAEKERVSKQLRQLEHEQTELLRQSGYTLAAWQQENAGPITHHASSLKNPFIRLSEELQLLERRLEAMAVDPDRAIQVCAQFLLNEYPFRIAHRSTETKYETAHALQRISGLETVPKPIAQPLAVATATSAAPLVRPAAPPPGPLPAKHGAAPPADRAAPQPVGVKT
jgi:hypothetical protein